MIDYAILNTSLIRKYHACRWFPCGEWVDDAGGCGFLSSDGHGLVPPEFSTSAIIGDMRKHLTERGVARVMKHPDEPGRFLSMVRSGERTWKPVANTPTYEAAVIHAYEEAVIEWGETCVIRG